MKLAAKTLLLVSLATTFTYSQSNNIPQVQHVIVVIQENRTPTNLFHEDAALVANGAHVIPPNNQGHCGLTPGAITGASWHCTDVTPANPAITLTGLSLKSPVDPNHNHYPGWYCTYHSGAMDGACHIAVTQAAGSDISACPGNGNLQYCPYSYSLNTKWDGTHGILDPYFNLANQYGFANWMFQTNQGPSQPAHLFLFAGTSAPDRYQGDQQNYWQWFAAENAHVISGGAGCTAANSTFDWELPPAPPQNPLWQLGYPPPGHSAGYPCFNSRTLVDLLAPPANISWRYYSANGGFAIWHAPNMIQSICQPSNGSCTYNGYTNNVYLGNPAQVLQDLGAGNPAPACNLQQVSWGIPDGTWSDHPGQNNTDAGPSWVAAIVNAVGGFNNDGTPLLRQCNYWQNTVVLVVWDDWGGWYDDVLPWNCQANGICSGYSTQSADYVYGFRVPLLVVGAYAKQGYISGACPGGNCSGHETPPYVHDFGSILNFIEYAFGQNGSHLGDPGGIGGINYPAADWLAPDGPNAPNCQSCLYSLSDFFDFTHGARLFNLIQGAKYGTNCFLNPTSCFANYPSDPDDDLIDND